MPSLRHFVIPIVFIPLLAAAQPRVATSFWKIATPAYSDMPGYRVLYEGKKARHCYPITDAYEPAWDPEYDTYHLFHHHGVAVESELMAYRIYFDKKQTIDVYCKRTPRLELAQSCWYPNDRQLAEHYGDDILRVGGTIGVGSVNYWKDGKICHFENVGERGQRIVMQNDSVAVISVSDVDWEVPGKRQMANFHADYTMQAGHRDMRCDVTVSEPVEGLCTGVQMIPAKYSTARTAEDSMSIQLPNGILIASFGTDWPVNDSVKYAKETVGLAVFIPNAYAGEQVHNKANKLCLLKLSEVSIEYSKEYKAHFYLTCCGVTKEDHPVAKTATEWYEYVKQWAKELK